MIRFPRAAGPALALAGLILSSQGASADVLQALDDATIRQTLCVGLACPDNPTPILPDGSSGGVHIMDIRTRIDFVDTSTSGGNFAANDWALITNSTAQFGDSYFSIHDTTASRIPFRIDAGAGTNGFRMASDGDVGLGTALPQTDLHVVGSSRVGLRLNATNAGTVMGNEAFEFYLDSQGIGLLDVGNFSWVPFKIAYATPPGSLAMYSGGLVVNEDGRDYDFTVLGDTDVLLHTNAQTDRIGIGTYGPEAALHMRRTDNTARMLVEDTGASGAQELFRLSNNGGSYFTFANTNAGTTWFFTHENASPNRFIIADGVADGPEMTLTANGDLTIPGQLFTAGSCAAGCDRVFDADYPLPTIPEQAAMMKELKHLPAVGPTPEDGPFNITAMTGGMLNELEKAHLYIAELEGRLAAVEARLAALD